MTRAEGRLHVLHILAGHALAEASLVLAQALRAHSQAEQQARQTAEDCQRAQHELVRLARAPAISPTTYDAVRGLLQSARSRDREARQQLMHAVRALDESRIDLSQCRQREAELACALKNEHEALRRAQQQRDDAILDDLWLQSMGART